MSKADYYDLLGIDRGVDEKALKSAFRKMAMQHHPDPPPNSVAVHSVIRALSSSTIRAPIRVATPPAFERHQQAS
ncbi:MAG: DnaJ domain-containing protein, partial [Pseudomonadota bacterium]